MLFVKKRFFRGKLPGQKAGALIRRRERALEITGGVLSACEKELIAALSSCDSV